MVLESQQNWTESTESSHLPITPTVAGFFFFLRVIYLPPGERNVSFGISFGGLSKDLIDIITLREMGKFVAE